MGRKAIDLMCQKFGRLRVVGDIEERRFKGLQWLCHCDCGKDVVLSAGNLRNGLTKSCGCLNLENITKHGHTINMRRTREYLTWSSMKARCYNSNRGSYPNYGGRGITVCKRWIHSFENFLEDMGERPEGMTIDRIDNNGNYEPGNCRWATGSQQRCNQRERAYA